MLHGVECVLGYWHCGRLALTSGTLACFLTVILQEVHVNNDHKS